jgi:excisionase family DNA binding protein
MGQMMAGMMSQSMQPPPQQPPAQQAAPAAPAGGGPAPEVMTPAEAAAYLKISEADVMAMITGGQVKAKQMGASYRISKKALDDFLNS